MFFYKDQLINNDDETIVLAFLFSLLKYKPEFTWSLMFISSSKIFGDFNNSIGICLINISPYSSINYISQHIPIIASDKNSFKLRLLNNNMVLHIKHLFNGRVNIWRLNGHGI